MPETPETLRPGTIGLARIPGPVGTLIRWGQRAAGCPPALAGWTHALIAVGDGMIVEARSGGAVCLPLGQATGACTLEWFTPGPLTDQLCQAIAWHARAMVGTPHSLVDHAALAAVRLPLGGLVRPLRRRVAGARHLTCSQLVDAAYAQAGVRLFTDGRLPGDVTPADLAALRDRS